MAKSSIREIWSNYRAEVVFGFVLTAVVIASTYLSRFIPVKVYDIILTPIFNICTFTVALTGAFIMFRHTEHLRMRRMWGYVLLVWGIGDMVYLVCNLIAPMQLMNIGAEHITVYELLLGNMLGWLMTLYPTETLRPGYLNGKTVLWQLLPMVALVGMDYIIPLDLWPVVALYPYVLLIITLSHIRAYRKWVENNFSSMDNIDEQWIIRYCIMLFIVGANYMYLNISHDHTRGFTQQWFVIFMLAYCTEQILFRKDPWVGVQFNELPAPSDEEEETEASAAKGYVLTTSEKDRTTLKEWMEREKPYTRPDFKLLDLMQVLPQNRTYLSKLISDTYSCSFYQMTNNYRVEEVKRLMREEPELRIGEIASRAGFASSSALSRVFSKETGMSPREWEKSLQ